MPEYSYEDARKYRRDADLALRWPSDVPPPPRDRVEFTRLMMNCAEEAGLGYPHPYRPICNPWDADKVRDFQNRIHRYTGRRSERFLPAHLTFYRRDDGRAVPEALTYTWAEYLPTLEADYLLPWRDACEKGVGEYTSAQVWASLRVKFLQSGKAEEIATPRTADEARAAFGNRRVADCLTPTEAEGLDAWAREWARLPFTVTERRTLPEQAAAGIFWGVAIVGSAVAVAGALVGLYPFWLLLILFPAALAAALGACALVHMNKDIPRVTYPNPALTFEELVNAVLAERAREWAEVERVYGKG